MMRREGEKVAAYEVLIYIEPTIKEHEEGKGETHVAGPITVMARDMETAIVDAVLALTDVQKTQVKAALNRLKVVVRPF